MHMTATDTSIQPNRIRMGAYSGLIRVNGRRSVCGTGHTVTEAERNTIAQARETWPHLSHIFDLIGRKPEVFA